MYIKSITALTITIILIGCGHSNLTHTSSDQLKVISEPLEAEVYVMDKLVGHTPLELSIRKIFPVTYPPEKEHLYGKVVLIKKGCEKMVVPVSMKRLSEGVHARLECKQAGTKAKTDTNKPDTNKPDNIKLRLKTLKGLREEDLISEKEYQQIRQRILDTL